MAETVDAQQAQASEASTPTAQAPTPPAQAPGSAALAPAPTAQTPDSTAGLPAIATWTAPVPTPPGLVPLSWDTGEPTRGWTIWVATIAGQLATASVAVSLFLAYGIAVFWYRRATWLMAQFPTDIASLERVLLVVAVTAIALVIGVACSITAYYAYDGRRWTRWSALVALVLSGGALTLNILAWPAILLAAIMAGALWLPQSRRYFDSWRVFRHREQVFSPPVDEVFYGPLPRYRAARS